MNEYSTESVLNLIPEEDYKTITLWRKNNLESHQNIENFMPSRNLLTTWALAKKDYLVKLFGGKLILTKTVQFERSEDELHQEFVDLLRYSDTDLLYDLKRALFQELYGLKYCYLRSQCNEITSGIFDMLNILNNKYTGESVTLFPNEHMPKGFKITHGSKIMKILRGLTEYFGFTGTVVEEALNHIMLSQSQINNSRYVEGTLNISIHPLDFMTMSDNNCNWSSCMSWAEGGCYRQGTIEMMNSPSVVIAYLEAKGPMTIDFTNYWNSKRWRQLFIVDPKVIIGVKGYPYRSDELASIVIDWLAELAEQNLNWHYKKEIFNLNSGGRVCLPYKDKEPVGYKEYICFNFVTRYMYNDFGCRHLLYLGENYNKYNELYYSGVSQCMCCGAINIELEHITSEAASITCYDCNGSCKVCYCENCGATLYEDEEIYYLNDTVYCEDCYYSFTSRCVRCGDYYANEDMTPIGLIYDKLTKPVVVKETICSYCIGSTNDFLGVNHLYKSTNNKDEADYYVYDSDRIEYHRPWGSYYTFNFDDPQYLSDNYIDLPPDLKKVY